MFMAQTLRKLIHKVTSWKKEKLKENEIIPWKSIRRCVKWHPKHRNNWWLTRKEKLIKTHMTISLYGLEFFLQLIWFAMHFNSELLFSFLSGNRR